MGPLSFFVENLILDNFRLKHFLIQSVLLAAISLKVNILPILMHYFKKGKS